MMIWVAGSPDNLAPGMVIRTTKGAILIGHCNEGGNFYGDNDQTLTVLEWAWLIEPGEFDRIAERRRDEYETGTDKP